MTTVNHIDINSGRRGVYRALAGSMLHPPQSLLLSGMRVRVGIGGKNSCQRDVDPSNTTEIGGMNGCGGRKRRGVIVHVVTIL